MAKGPKTLNPADKARKEARKKELKKNKKQRQQIRSAAIESRDPEQILADLENLDKLEFDITNINNPDYQPGTNNDILYKEKRKRLKELLTRVISYYQKEDPEKHVNLKKLEAQYESNHKKLEREFEAIRAAQEATVDDVILPPEPDLQTNLEDDISDDDLLMSEAIYITPLTVGTLKPPGCPPGPPPDFEQLVDSLKSSIATPPAFIAQTIPQNLLNLSMARPNSKNVLRNKVRHVQGNKIPPPARDDNLKGQIKMCQERHQFDSVATSSRIDNAEKSSKASDGVKSQTSRAVIESKPVLFMQKATKFVPASVRAKVRKPK